MWALCVTQLGAVLSWRMTGSSQPSLLPMNWVSQGWGHGAPVMSERAIRGEVRGQ